MPISCDDNIMFSTISGKAFNKIGNYLCKWNFIFQPLQFL